MTKSIAKGKKGERELCRRLRKLDYGAIRSQQVAGLSRFDKSADILTSFPHVRWEVKRTGSDTKLSHEATIEPWVEKARIETPPDQYWVVAWRPDYGQWRFFIDPGLFWTSVDADDDIWAVDNTPYVLIPNLVGAVEALDPAMDCVVDDPDEWMPDEKTQLA